MNNKEDNPIYQFRKKFKLTQKETAKLFKKSERSIQYFEADHHSIPEDVLFRLEHLEKEFRQKENN